MFYLKSDYYIYKLGLDKRDFTEEELQELEDRLQDERKEREIEFLRFYNQSKGK